MSRRGESDTFNLSSSDIYDVINSVFGASANTIPGYAETNSSARNVPYTGVPQSTYDVLQNPDRSSANEMYSGNNNHPPSLVNNERNSDSLLQERLLNILDAYNTSDSSAFEAALKGFRPSVPSSSQSAPRQDWNQEYSQSHQLKELANLIKSNTTQTLCDSSEASSDAESSKPFNDLNLNIDEEDEFLYGDSNSLPEIPKSFTDYPVESKKVILGTGWSDDEDDNDITDDNSPEGTSIAARSIWDARNRGEITQSDVSLLLDKLSSIKRDEKALPKIPMGQFFPPVVKEPFVASPQRSEESYREISAGISSYIKTEKQSKYHAAAQILKNRILEETRLVTESSSSGGISDIAEFHREVSETDSRITNKSSKISVSNKPDSETDKLPVNQQKHIPKASVQKDIECIKNYIKDLTGESIHPGVESEQESQHFRYEPNQKVSPPRHYSPLEIIRYNYSQKPSPHIRPRSPNVQRLPSPHLSRPPNSDNERKTLESRYRSLEKHRQDSHSPEKQRGSHDRSPGRYRNRMRSPGSQKSKRSRSPGSQRSRNPGSQRSKRSRSPESQRSKRSRSPGSQRLKRSRSPGSHRSKRSRSPGYYRSRRSRRSPSRRSRERSRSPRRRHRSRSPRSYRSRERSKSPRRHKSQERNTIAKGKSDDKTKKSLSSSQKKPDEKKKSRDSRSSSSSSNSSSDSGSSSSSDSSVKSSSRRGRDNRKKELSEKKTVPKNEITGGSTKSLDVANVKNTATATAPPEDLAKKISDILVLCPPKDYNFGRMTFVESMKLLKERLKSRVAEQTISHPERPQSTQCNTLQTGLPMSALFEHPCSIQYPQSSQVDPQQTLDVPNVMNVTPQSELPNFANDNLHPVQMNAFKIKKPTLRQIEVSNDLSSWNKDPINKFEEKVQEKDKVQEIKEKQHMKAGYPKSDSAAESNYKRKNYYIEKYKILETDRQLKQLRARNTANDGAEMLKIMNKAFGRRIYGSEQMIHAKCKDLFKVSRDVFDITLKEKKQAEENLKEFKSGIPPEFEKDVLAIKVDLTEEEATDEVYTCFDLGDHTCILCNGKFTCIANMMAHIQSEKHIKQADACDNNWKAFFAKERNKMDVASKKKCDKVQAVQGIEFMKPLIGFFCDLCKETSLDKESAEEHLKSHTHFVNFKSFIKKNPLYEQKYLLKHYVQMNMLAKIKRQKEMDRQKRKEEKQKREEEASEKAKAAFRKEKSIEIKFDELDDTEVVSVSNVQSSPNTKGNLSSPGKKSQKESAAKFAYIGKAPNYRKSQDQNTPANKAIPWYKKESYKKSDDVREENRSETKDNPLNSERESLPSNAASVSNLSESKDYEQKQKHKVLHESNTSKKDSSRYSPSDIFNEKSSKSQSGQYESNTSKKDKDVNRYSPSDIFSQKLPNSASSASSVHQDIPLPKEKPSKPFGQPSKVESVPMDIDNSQDTSFKKPSVALSEEEKLPKSKSGQYESNQNHTKAISDLEKSDSKDVKNKTVEELCTFHKTRNCRSCVPYLYNLFVNSKKKETRENVPVSATWEVTKTQSSLGDGKNVKKDSSQNLPDFSVPPPSVAPAPYGNNRPPMSNSKQWGFEYQHTLHPANQGNSQSVGLHSYQQNNNPSMFVYSNTYNIQSFSSFTNVPPPSFRNHPNSVYPNPSNIPYAPSQQQQYYPPANMSPMQAFSNTNRFSLPPPGPGRPHAYASPFSNPSPYSSQSNVPSLPAAAPQTFVSHSSVGNPFPKSTTVNPNPIIQTNSAVKANPVIQATSVSSIQSKSPSFTNQNKVSKPNLIEIVRDKYIVSCNKDENVVNSGAKSAQKKETSGNVPVSSTSQTTSLSSIQSKSPSFTNQNKVSEPNLIEIVRDKYKVSCNKDENIVDSGAKSVQKKETPGNVPVSSTSQTTSVSSIQSKSPSFTNQNKVSKPNLIEIVRDQYKVSCNKDENVVDSGDKSVQTKETSGNVPVSSTSQTSSDDVENVKKDLSCINYQYYLFLNSKKKETCENAPVSSTSEVTNTQGSLGDGENVKKDSSQNHTKIIPNLEELSNKDEKNKVAKQVPEKLSEIPSKSENEDNKISAETIKCLEGENIKTSKWDVRENTVKCQIGSAMEDEKSKKPCTSEEGLPDDLVNIESDSEDKKNKDEESDIKTVKEKEVTENVPVSSTSEVSDIKTGLDDVKKNTKGGFSPNNEIQTIQNIRKKTVKSQIQSVMEDISDDGKLKNPCTSGEGLPGDLINKESESDSKSVKEKESSENVPVSSTSEVTDIQSSLDDGKHFSSQNHKKIIPNLEELGNKDEKNKIEESYTKSVNLKETSENVPGSSTSENFKEDCSQNHTKIISDLEECSKDEKNKIVESDTESVKEKEISQNFPVSSTSEVTDIKTSLDDGENVKKDSSQSHTKIVPNLEESDSEDGKNNVVKHVSEKLSTTYENLDDIEDNEISIITVKRLKGKNRKTKKQNVRNDTVKLVVPVLEDISDDETFKKPCTSDECLPDDTINKTNEDSKIDENISKISDPSDCSKNLTDSIKSSDKELMLGDCVKDIKRSEIGDSASISEDCVIIYDECENPLAQGNKKTKPKVTRKRKLAKQRIQPSRKQTSASSNNVGAEGSHLGEIAGKKVKENQEENKVLSSYLQNVVDVKECNNFSGVEKFKMSVAVSKFDEDLGHSSNDDDKTCLSEKQESAIDSENMQKETENVVTQASTEPEIVNEKFDEKSIFTGTNSCTSVKEDFEEKSLFTATNSCTSGNEILPDIASEITSLGKEEISEMMPNDNEKSEVMEVDGVEETDSSKNVSESFNLPSTAIGKEEISENISSPETSNETMPDIHTETIVLVTEETSEIIDPREKASEVKEVKKTRKRRRRRRF